MYVHGGVTKWTSLVPRLSRAPARKESLASFEGFLGFFERTLNDVMRDCHVTNTWFRSGFPFCILCARTYAHTVPPATLFLEEPSDSDGYCISLLFLVFR